VTDPQVLQESWSLLIEFTQTSIYQQFIALSKDSAAQTKKGISAPSHLCYPARLRFRNRTDFATVMPRRVADE
jgi:hypothetical protein